MAIDRRTFHELGNNCLCCKIEQNKQMLLNTCTSVVLVVVRRRGSIAPTEIRIRDIFRDMATTTDNLFEAALALSELDRAELVGRLLETLDTETEEGVEAAWVREIDTRVKELETGEVKTVPWEAVRSRLHRTASV